MAVWHGRVLLQRKGLDVLLNAWEQVRAQRSNQDLRLLLVGSGNNAAELRQRLAVRSLTGVVWVDRFIQDRAILRTRLAAAEVYVLPSRHESFPVALIEAMSCGLPVVAAAAPGVTDILEGGEEAGGLVVPCGDAVALAEALGWLLGDDVLSRELGLRARRCSEAGFSFDAVGKQLRSFVRVNGLGVNANVDRVS
jgi:glycosyltransferase involved in cell wall biosynthesis